MPTLPLDTGRSWTLCCSRGLDSMSPPLSSWLDATVPLDARSWTLCRSRGLDSVSPSQIPMDYLHWTTATSFDHASCSGNSVWPQHCLPLLLSWLPEMMLNLDICHSVSCNERRFTLRISKTDALQPPLFDHACEANVLYIREHHLISYNHGSQEKARTTRRCH